MFGEPMTLVYRIDLLAEIMVRRFGECPSGIESIGGQVLPKGEENDSSSDLRDAVV